MSEVLRTTSGYLDELVDALQSEPRRSSFCKASLSQLRTFADDGWALLHDLEDVLLVMDSRLDPYSVGDLDRLLSLFDLGRSGVAFRPMKIAKNASLWPALPAADSAYLLINLEAIGFAVDPAPLVEYILPTLSKRRLLSKSELRIFWYSRDRHKGAAVTIEPNDLNPVELREWTPATLVIRTAAGYRAEVWKDKSGNVVRLRVNAPGYRNTPPPVKTTCPDCGHAYWKGDRESSHGHRTVHRKAMRLLDPQPHDRLSKAIGVENEAELVTTSSPAWKHQEMYDRALAFKRQFHYDFVLWGSRRGNKDQDARGFLFADERCAIVGACAFRQKGDSWTLKWVWICPKHRRCGHLARRWPRFRERFGDFLIEGPVSREMFAFLRKLGDEHLVEGWPNVSFAG